MNNTRENQKRFPKSIFREISKLRRNILKFKSVDIIELCGEELNSKNHNIQKIKLKPEFGIKIFFAVTVSCLTFGLINFNFIVEYLLSIRCLLPNNYLIYEACRPIDSNCKFCVNVNRPIILTSNLTQAEFSVKLQSTSQHKFTTVSFNFYLKLFTALCLLTTTNYNKKCFLELASPRTPHFWLVEGSLQ